MSPDMEALDRAIRDQHASFHAHVMVLQDYLMRPDSVPLRPPLHQILVALYRLIDVIGLGEAYVESSDVDSFGGIPREEYPGIVAVLDFWASFYERMLKVDRGMLLGDAM